MVVAHFGCLILKMLAPNVLIKIHGGRMAGVSTLEKLQALGAGHEAAARLGDQDPAPSSWRQRVMTSAPHVQPSDNGGIPVKTIQISTDATQTTHITGDLGDK
jgi:hypothetical protein